MRRQTKKSIRHAATLAGRLLSVVVSVAIAQHASCAEALATSLGENDPEARFSGAPTYDLAVTNVKWEAGTKDCSFVTFDVSWGHSWRAKWTEPAEKNVTGKPLELENWDAAWIFVKYLPEKDSPKSIERNHWQHATLDTDAAHHVMPAGATNTVGLSDGGVDATPSSRSDARGGGAASTSGGRRGMGVFIYRDAIGHGANNFKGVKLRWQHGTDSLTSLGASKVDPVRAAIKVHALAMVYVPRGPFKVGSPLKIGIGRFPDGLKRPIVGGPLSGHDRPGWPEGSFGAFTDGAWRGGEPLIPFLVDAEWNGPVAEVSRARRFAPRPGYLWWNMVYDYHNRSYAHGVSSLDPVNDDYPPATFHNDYPTGYDAFYAMKHPVSQGQYVTFLNSLPPDVAVERRFIVTQGWKADTNASSGDKSAKPVVSIDASGIDALVTEGDGDGVMNGLLADIKAEEGKEQQRQKQTKVEPPKVHTAPDPEEPCGWIGAAEGYCYAVWAGLRPLTALEAVKVGRGPSDPARTGNGEASAERAGKAAGRTYWGGHGAGSVLISAAHTNGRAFRGTHGNGMVPPVNPGVPDEKTAWWMTGKGRSFETTPNDWPKVGDTWRGQLVCGRTEPATHKATAAERRPSPQTAAKKYMPADWPPEAPPADAIKVANVKWEAGAGDYSLVTFDLAWENSWRAAWMEPAEKNVTGKPLKIESWDAAWVFVKFRKPGDMADSHAALSTRNDDHRVPAGAVLDVGLTDDRNWGVGAFIYRDGVGHGPVAYKGVTLKWLHPSSSLKPETRNLPARHSLGDGGKPDIRVHAIEMVHVAECPFKSKSPLYTSIAQGKDEAEGGTGRAFGRPLPLSLITSADATRPGGYFANAGRKLPDTDDWPNGYGAFYCMKRSITQGRFAEFLNSAKGLDHGGQYFIGATAGETSKPNDPKLHYARFHGLAGYTITTNAMGEYVAHAPDRACCFLSWPDIKSYASWAGLRPPTNLEYEKACRGPRDFAREEDAWAEGICAPFDSAPDFVKEPRREGPDIPEDPGPSYWGIRQLSLSGCSHEWPGTIGNGIGRMALDFKGTHGNGMPNAPGDWPPTTAFGEWFYMSWEAGGSTVGFADIGIWVLPSQMSRVGESLRGIDADRTGRYGAHAVRTAPARSDRGSPLVMDPLPDLAGYDLALFHLSGRFRNEEDKPLKVEVTSTLPDACFPDGAAARAFTAAPKSATPFKILTAVTRPTATNAVRRGALLPIQVRIPGGSVLAEGFCRLAVDDPAGVKPLPIGSLAGDQVTLRFTNATDRSLTVAVELAPPPGVKVAETNRSVTVATGAETTVAFPVPRQAFAGEGLCRIPYRLSVAKGAPQSGEIAVTLQVQSRWWLSRRVAAGPNRESADDPGTGADEIGDFISAAGDVFQHATPPKGWEPASAGAAVPLGKLGALPELGSLMLAATRVQSPANREVTVLGPRDRPPEGKPPRLVYLIWLNHEVVHDSRANPTAKPTPCRLRQGDNTLVVECRTIVAGAVTLADAAVQFNDAKDGNPVNGLLFDIEKEKR